MRLSTPYKSAHSIGQKFGENFNAYYASKGLKGHTGWDLLGAHKTPLYASIDGYCYSVQNKDNTNLGRYRAVYQLIQDNDVWYELSYGHLWDIAVAPKTMLKRGDFIGTQGNTGNVFTGGKEVTQEEKESGSGKGSHCHYQLRLVKPVDKKEVGKQYLSDMNGTLKYLNKYWEIPLYKNGYSGCVDIEPFWEKESNSTIPFVTRIKALQTFLNQYGAKLTVDGVFGPLSKKALEEFLQ